MALAFLKPQVNSQTLLVFGKLPSHPDFIRVNASHPLAQELDQVIQVALESIASQPGWEARYDAMASSDLMYPSADGRWFFHGMITPSRDQTGRRFPILAGLAEPMPDVRRLPVAPLARETFLFSLRAQLEAYGSADALDLECAEFLGLGEGLGGTDDGEWELARSIHQRILTEEAPPIFAQRLHTLCPATRLSQALLNIAFYHDFLQRFQTPNTTQLLDLPLGNQVGETPLYASAWLSMLQAMGLLDLRLRTSVLITDTATTARMRVSFSRGLLRLFQLALGHPLTPECFLDTTTELTTWQAHRLYPQSMYAMDRLLDDPDLSLAHLVQFLADLQQKITATSH